MRFGYLAAGAALMVAAPALAHVKLVSSTPAANAVVAAPSKLQLVFSEPVLAKLSGVDLEMTEMPGMKMTSPHRMQVSVAVAGDGRTMVVSLAKPLTRGAYKLVWHAVANDTHRVEGNFSFKVK